MHIYFYLVALHRELSNYIIMKLSEVKDNSACIYKLTFPDGKSYVGQTKDLYGRVKLYISNYEQGKQTGVDRIISEFGLDEIEIDVLCRIVNLPEVEERLCLNILEIHYIKELGTLSPNGYNTSYGGEIFGIQPELFAYGSDAVKNYYRGNSKAVLRYNLDGSFDKEYASISEASYDTGISEDKIRAAIKKHKSLHGSFILCRKRGLEIPERLSVEQYDIVKKKKVVTEVVVKTKEYTRYVISPCLLYDADGNFVAEYKYKSDAIKAFNMGKNVNYGIYRNGFIMYKKPEDGKYPLKIEPQEEACKKILGDYYKPLSECDDVLVVKKVRKKSKLGLDFPIVQMSLSGKLVAYFDSIRDAAQITGIPYSGIYACVNGKTKKSNGYVWKKIEE